MTSSQLHSQSIPSDLCVQPLDLRSSNFKLIKPLSGGKFSVFLANVGNEPENLFALKVIPFNEGSPSSFFSSEIQFSNLSHPNIIVPIHYERERQVSARGGNAKSSIILSEYAPNFDFYTAIAELNVDFDEKLARTYFRQLVSGLEYLHSNSVAHLDLKLENIVLDKDFRLRIIDFDLAQKITEENQFVCAGTKNYRAPEIVDGKCYNAFAADIFSLGVVLFELLSGGTQPYLEDDLVNDIDLMQAFLHDKTTFWAVHESISGPGFWEAEAMNLIENLCNPDVEKRFTIDQIKAHPWFNGEVYSDAELKAEMAKTYRRCLKNLQ